MSYRLRHTSESARPTNDRWRCASAISAMHVSHLRKKIEATETPLIRTVRGSGYMMTPNQE